MINLPTPYAAGRITAFLSEHLCWSAFWDKRDGVAGTRSSRTVLMAHNTLERAIRHAEANDYVRRNVAALVKPPIGQTGRPSRSLTSTRPLRCSRPRMRRRWEPMSCCAC